MLTKDLPIPIFQMLASKCRKNDYKQNEMALGNFLKSQQTHAPRYVPTRGSVNPKRASIRRANFFNQMIHLLQPDDLTPLDATGRDLWFVIVGSNTAGIFSEIRRSLHSLVSDPPS